MTVVFYLMCFAQKENCKKVMLNQQENNVCNHSSLSSCLSPGDGARAGSGDFEGVRERFCARTGDLDAERLLERE